MKDSKFVICINNSAYPVSLEKLKIYKAYSDPDAEKLEHIRVMDESGEEYLYPASCFIDANLSKEASEAVIKAA
jgi:hypothetical protein